MRVSLYWRRALYGAGVASGLLAATAHAQLDVGAGLAVPTGGFGTFRGSGPLVQLGLVQRDSSRFRMRWQLEAAWMPGTTTEPGWQGGDARLMTGLVGFTLGNRGPDALYVLLAVAGHSMTIEGARNPYGILWGTRLGVGVRWQMGRLLGRAELAPHLILSDYGTTELSPSSFWAAVGGLTF